MIDITAEALRLRIHQKYNLKLSRVHDSLCGMIDNVIRFMGKLSQELLALASLYGSVGNCSSLAEATIDDSPTGFPPLPKSRVGQNKVILHPDVTWER